MKTTRSTPTSSAPAGWAAPRLARDLWRRFATAARAMPREAWGRWAKTLAAGLAITCLVSLALTLWARSADPQWLAAWDREQLEGLLAREPISFAHAIVYESPGNGVTLGILIGATLLLAIYAARPVVAANMLAGYGVGAAAFWVGWGLWDRARPDLVLGGAAAPGLHSFPSGHMVHVTAIYGYLTYLWWRSSASPFERLLAVALCAAWVALVAVARLVLGTHWPSDILAGALLGLLVALTLAAAHAAAERPSRP